MVITLRKTIFASLRPGTYDNRDKRSLQVLGLEGATFTELLFEPTTFGTPTLLPTQLPIRDILPLLLQSLVCSSVSVVNITATFQ